VDILFLEAHAILHMEQHQTIIVQVDGHSLEQHATHLILPHVIPITHVHLVVHCIVHHVAHQVLMKPPAHNPAGIHVLLVVP
jgi:hypothetical protein